MTASPGFGYAELFNNGGTNAINNAGTFNCYGVFNSNIGIPFNNAGAVNVHSGALNLWSGGNHSGAFSVASGWYLNFEGGTHTFNSGSSLTGAGMLRFSGVNNLTGGMIQTTGQVLFLGGTLAINGDQTINDLFWNHGTMTGTGTTTIGSGGVLQIDRYDYTYLTNRDLENEGTVNHNGYMLSSGYTDFSLRLTNSTIHNRPGATYNANGGTSIVHDGGVNNFINEGTFNKTGLNAFILRVPFNNFGTINVEGGILSSPLNKCRFLGDEREGWFRRGWDARIGC